MNNPSLKQLHELKHIVAVWNFKPHESAPVLIIEDDGKFYISVFDYVTGQPISLKRQRGDGERPFASLDTAYNAIRTGLEIRCKHGFKL
jgi:hypothetical protein